MQPYLSVVAASRNDDHGGDPLHRTQIFINSFAQQCDKFKLPAELILVDWNPVPDRPGLASVLQLPRGSEYCSARVITVPAVLHQTIKYSDRLAFFQMIAKNAGIRRALGDFVLATNIDIIFSDELVAYLAEQRLDPKLMYRVDRYDIKVDLPLDASSEYVLEKAWKSIIRTNRRANLQEVLDPIYGYDQACRDCGPYISKHQPSDKIRLVRDGDYWNLRPHPDSPIEHLNTNACGDFTLLSKEGWAAIRGYPDFEAFSFNIDSMGLVMAHYEGYHEASLLPPCVCFHIEHGLGSGYTPEGEQTLFERIRKRRILSPDWPVLNVWVDQMRKQQRSIEFNRDNWGLADHTLPEQPIGSPDKPDQTELLCTSRPTSASVGSLYQQYDLDSATLFFEREARQPTAIQAPPAAVAEVAAQVLAPVVQPPGRRYCNDMFDHEHDSHSLRDQYANGRPTNRPLAIFGSETDIAQIRAVLAQFVDRKLVLGDAFSTSAVAQSTRFDALLLATDPRQMVMSLQRNKLLTPPDEDAELVIWVLGGDDLPSHIRHWLPSVKLARRLLDKTGWRVRVESQRALR